MKHVQNERGGYFAAERDGKEAGRMSYVGAGQNIMIIDHTNVSPDSQGSGVGTEMVKAAVDYARQNGRRLMATCPFARAVLIKHPEWQDVVAG